MNRKLKEKTKDIIRLSIPYTGANLLQAISEQATIALLAKTNASTLAAYGLLSLSYPINLLFTAPLTALPPIISALHGENDKQAIVTILQQGWTTGLLLCIPQAIILTQAKPLLELLGQPKQLIAIAESSFYLNIITLPTTSLFITNKSYAYGTNRTLPLFLLSAVSLLSNVSLTAFLVLGPPKLGLKAYVFSAIGQGIIENLAMTAYLKYISSHEAYPFFTYTTHHYKPLAKRFLKLGGSTTAKILLIVISTTYKQLLIGLNGEKAILATQAINVYTGYPRYINDAISMAICTLIGQSIGKKDSESIRYYYQIALVSAVGTSLAFALPCFIIPDRILQLSNIEENEDFTFAKNLCYMNAIQLIVNAVSQISTGAFLGTEDSIRPAVISFLTFLAVILPFSLSFHFFTDLGVLGIEWSYFSGSLVQAIAMPIFWNKKSNHLASESERLDLISIENDASKNSSDVAQLANHIERTPEELTIEEKSEEMIIPFFENESSSLNSCSMSSCYLGESNGSLSKFGTFKLYPTHTQPPMAADEQNVEIFLRENRNLSQ